MSPLRFFITKSQFLDRYRLHVSQQSGMESDRRSRYHAYQGLTRHHNAVFSTYDKMSEATRRRCELGYDNPTGWWFKPCQRSNLNGVWGAENASGIYWKSSGNHEFPTFTEMKIRRISGLWSTRQISFGVVLIQIQF
ncbi:tenascin [Elysia marginata]|uniref:Tenascin n=1 Tax=Elysia marginata TaxID=1093978 RepID=A0AAV4I554_9GAST|nr:tenascin [Elysia marginata]